MKNKIFRNLSEKVSREDNASLDALKRRTVMVVMVVMFFLVIIVFRLWFLQIYKGQEFSKRADSNRVRISKISAPRGRILGSRGEEIVTNRASFNVVLVRENALNVDAMLKKLAKILDKDVSYFWQRIREASGNQNYVPILLAKDIDWSQLAYLESHNQEFPGLRIEVVPVREYHMKDFASHLIGYLGEVNRAELEKKESVDLDRGDLVGKKGLEKLLDAQLRGEKGNYSSEVNALGFEQQLLRSLEPLPGKDVKLTIDVDLQRAAENAMGVGEKAGAVVVMNVKNGNLLASVSTPQLHLADFLGGISHKKWKQILDNPRHPLLNKVVQGQYPPGSTYKMITALAGLTEGVIDEETMFYCPGYYSLGKHRFRCWKHSGHGAVDLNRAIAESCDVYFYQVGLQVGVDVLAEFANKLGLGKKTGLLAEYEKPGLVPTTSWKLDAKEERWHKGETLSVAIGQGFNLVTPLQICLMTAMIANGGELYRPNLIYSFTDASGKTEKIQEPELIEKVEIPPGFLDLIREGMVEVVHGKKGTGRRARIEGVKVGGKTGTAQVVRLAQYKHLKEKDIPYKYRDHAWFTCYAPADDPEIAVTVLVEHGLHGSSSAAPVARAVLDEYFKRNSNYSEALHL